jgi:peptidase E
LNFLLASCLLIAAISDVVGEETMNIGDNSGGNVALPNISTNNAINFPIIVQGEYTSLLLGLDQDASAARKLQFDTGANDTTM